MADAAVGIPSTGTEPPSYDGFGFEALVRSSNGNSDLPAYTRRPTPPPTQNRTPREFTFDLKNRSGVVWGGITVEGDPRLTKTVPTILEGTEIVGSAHLKLKTTEAMQAVCVIVKGEVLGSAQQGMASVVPLVFLEMRHVLWTASEGDPNASETTVPTTNRIGSKLNGIKLKGDYSWPFTISLPEEVAKEGKTYRLPHSFTDRTAVCSVRYTIELRVVRGKLRPDDKMAFPFAFFSMQQPTHPSSLRMLSYQENSPLLGPDADPEGWMSFPLHLKGMLFAARVVEVKLLFSLATPLCYTRSASIPCAMTIGTSDTQAMDLLSAPGASLVYLERTTHENSDTGANWAEPVGQANFWPSTEGGSESELPNVRRLMGEIHLRATMQPSSAVFGFSTQYSVVVFAPQAAGFKSPQEAKPLMHQPVQIATRFAPGPRQKTYSPPTYERKNLVVEQYYYNLVIQHAAQSASRMRGRGGRGPG